MTGQHQEALDQARNEHGHDHQGNGPDDLTDLARHHEERQEGGDACQRCRHHRRQHSSGAEFRRFGWAGARGALSHGMLADHDGVVHDDADGHDEREQAHHVDRLAGQHHYAEGGEQRDGNADRDPEGDPRAQEDEQHQHHQSQPARAVAEQHVDAVVDEFGRIVVVLDDQGRRQRRPHLLEKVIEDARLLQRIGRARPSHLQLDGGVARPVRDSIPLVKAFADGRDVAEVDLGPVLARDDLDLADLFGRSGEAQASDLLVGAGRDDAGGLVGRARADPGRDIAEREVELAQAPLANLDPDLLTPAAEQVDLVDPGGKQTLPDVLGVGPQRRLGERAGDDDIAYVLIEVEAVDDRLLGVLRQSLDPIHGVFDIGQRRIEIRPRLELHDDRADAFHGLCEDALDAVEKTDLRLDCRDDVGIDILGAGAGPGHAD